MALPGIGTFLGGIGALFGKGSTYIQSRVEKLKNEKAKLEEERGSLEKINMDITNPEHRKKSVRLSAVIERINAIDKLLANKASD